MKTADFSSKNILVLTLRFKSLILKFTISVEGRQVYAAGIEYGKLIFKFFAMCKNLRYLAGGVMKLIKFAPSHDENGGSIGKDSDDMFFVVWLGELGASHRVVETNEENATRLRI
ncbi:hypothetical protein U1Q18_049125 [Sarracenia purpurea var. burkii]